MWCIFFCLEFGVWSLPFLGQPAISQRCVCLALCALWGWSPVRAKASQVNEVIEWALKSWQDVFIGNFIGNFMFCWQLYWYQHLKKERHGLQPWTNPLGENHFFGEWFFERTLSFDAIVLHWEWPWQSKIQLVYRPVVYYLVSHNLQNLWCAHDGFRIGYIQKFIDDF